MHSTTDPDPDQKRQRQADAERDALVGQEFAERYKIISVIGHGGMSTVYKALHTYMDRIVAVKVLHPHLLTDPTSLQRFQHESKLASCLSHPNIITVHDFGITRDNKAFLVMDYLEGITLGEILDSSGAVSEHEALEIFRQICKGLMHAHKKNVIHRDLKPRNLVLTSDEDSSILVKIVDFGIAKIMPLDGEVSQALTQTGEVFGSPIYMSPEQCAAEKLDQRSDIYSLGCVMYEVLSGMPPLLGANPVETMSMHVNEEPLPINESISGFTISKRTEEAIMTCLQKKARDRFQSVAELLENLPEPHEIKPAVTDGGTIAMRLADIVTGEIPRVTGATQKRGPARRSKYRLKNYSRVLGAFSTVAILVVFSFLAFYPGPAEDPGTPLAKLKWQTLMSISDWLIKNKQYTAALPVLDWAVADARHLGDDHENYDKLIETLSKQVRAYSMLGMTKQEELGVTTIMELDKERWRNRSLNALEEIEAAEKRIAQIKKQGKDPKDFRDDPTLNFAGSVLAIVEMARRLDAVRDYELEARLLGKADKVLTEVYSDRFIGLASVKLQYAECLRKVDRIQLVNRLKLYEDAVRIRKLYAESQGKALADSPEYIRTLLKLGQWQRDRSEFDRAEPNILEAIRLAEKCHQIPKYEKAEYYNSYADFLTQTGRETAARSYQEKADNLLKEYEVSESARHQSEFHEQQDQTN